VARVQRQQRLQRKELAAQLDAVGGGQARLDQGARFVHVTGGQGGRRSGAQQLRAGGLPQRRVALPDGPGRHVVAGDVATSEVNGGGCHTRAVVIDEPLGQIVGLRLAAATREQVRVVGDDRLG